MKKQNMFLLITIALVGTTISIHRSVHAQSKIVSISNQTDKEIIVDGTKISAGSSHTIKVDGSKNIAFSGTDKKNKNWSKNKKVNAGHSVTITATSKGRGIIQVQETPKHSMKNNTNK